VIYAQPTEEEILESIDLGVPWLAAQQNTDGSWGTSEQVAYTGFALTKLCDYAFERGLSPFDDDYLYKSKVENGFNYIFGKVVTYGTGKGLCATPNGLANNYHHETYNAALALMAVAVSRTPERVINFPGNALVHGLTFKQLQDEMVQHFIWSQTTNSGGGWAYSPSYPTDDNSHTGYVTLALKYAETEGSTIPGALKDNLSTYIDYIQNDASGGSGYMDPTQWVNLLKTGNLLTEMAFVGDALSDARVQAALNFIESHWSAANGSGYEYGIDDPQTMYCLMKGFESFDIKTISVSTPDDTDWFAAFAQYLIDHQSPDGSWSTLSFNWGNVFLNTSWALLVLEKIAPPPVCPEDIVVNNAPGECGAVVEFDVSGPYWATITLIDGLESGETFPVGVTNEVFEINRAREGEPDDIVYCEFTVTVNDVEPPEANCKPANVELDENGKVSIVPGDVDNDSSDNCEIASLSVAPDEFTCANLGENTVVLTVEDNAGLVSTCEVIVTVVDLLPPVPDLDPLPDVIGECDATVETVPTATDNCAGTVIGTTSDPLFYDEQGTYTITWTYDDGNGNVTIQTQTVIVEDVTPPTISAVTEPFLLKQNNHKYVTFSMDDFNVATDDNCGVDTWVISRATSDEEEDGLADGSTLNDMVISEDCQSIMVRKERAGNGNGRVYTVELLVTDVNGNTATTSVWIHVPHNTKAPVIDDGPVYGVSGDCFNKSGFIPENEMVSTEYELKNYPNPFNNSTTIQFTIPMDSYVMLKVYNIFGQEMNTLVNQRYLSGTYTVQFDAGNLPAGQYLYRLHTSDVTITRKMLLSK
jgi:hypothetical protein